LLNTNKLIKDQLILEQDPFLREEFATMLINP